MFRRSKLSVDTIFWTKASHHKHLSKSIWRFQILILSKPKFFKAYALRFITLITRKISWCFAKSCLEIPNFNFISHWGGQQTEIHYSSSWTHWYNLLLCPRTVLSVSEHRIRTVHRTSSHPSSSFSSRCSSCWSCICSCLILNWANKTLWPFSIFCWVINDDRSLCFHF